MAHLNKKKLSLSERFGTIGPVDYQSKACKNSEMVSKLQMQITEVVRKRTDGNVRESQAKMISEEISDVQHRFDDVPVACQKFTPFKVELKVNKSNKQAENQNGTERKVHSYNAWNIEGSNSTDYNEKRQDYVNRIEVHHDPRLRHSPVKELPTFQEQPKKDPNRSPGNQKSYQSWKQKHSAGNYSEQNNEKQKAEFQKTNSDQRIKNSSNSNGAQTSQNFNRTQSCKSSPNFKKGKGPKYKKGKGSKASPKFNKGQGSKASPNFNKGSDFKASPNFNKGRGSKASPNFNKGHGSKASPNFNKGPDFKARPNFNKGPGFKTSSELGTKQGLKISQTSPNFNSGPGCKASPDLNNGQHCFASPNLNKGQGFQTTPNLNKGQGFQTTPNLNKGQGFQTTPNLNKGQGFQTTPNLNKGQGFQTSPNLNQGQGFQTSSDQNKGQGFQTNPHLNKGQDFQTNPNINKGPGVHTSQGFNKRVSFQTSPNCSNSPGFQVSPNLHHINDNRQCLKESPNENTGQQIQMSSDLNKGKDFQASPNFNNRPGFQASPGFKQNVQNTFGCNKRGSRNTQENWINVQQDFGADTFASDNPSTIYDIQDQFYNYDTEKKFSKGRHQRANFHHNNNPGFRGHLKNQRHSFSSNSHQYHNQGRPCNLQASTNNVVQPPVYTSCEQSYAAGGFGKRHGSPVGSNNYMSPAKKRMLATVPLNKDIPSFQNRLPSSNPPWQGNCCTISSDNNYVENKSLPYGYYPGRIPNAPFHPPVAGNYGLALHGPFTPKTWNTPTQNYTSNIESTDALATVDNKFHPLDKIDDMSSTKQYLFNKMLDQNDARSTEDVLKTAEDNAKPIGDTKPTGDVVKPSGGILKPTGFYQERANESSVVTAPVHKEKEETELVSTLLTQCQAMAQKDDDRQALHTIFNIIHQEMGHQHFQGSSVKSKVTSTDYKPEQTRSFSDASMNGDDAKFSPTSSSPDAASKKNDIIQFEGRTLLKGGVKPRHIPKTLVNKQDEDPPRDPRHVKDSKTQPQTARKMKDLPLPPFFIEFVATEKFGKKKSDDGKLKQALQQDTEKNMNDVNNQCIPSAGFKTTEVKTGIGKIDTFINESNLDIKQQKVANENIVAEMEKEKCGPDTLETRNSDVISHILPRITVRQEHGVNVSDKASMKKDHVVDANSRDPRLRVTSISKKRNDNPTVDLMVLKYEESRVGQQHNACDDVNGKTLECVLEPKQTQYAGNKECNQAYLMTNLSRDGHQFHQRNSPMYHKDIGGRETNISRIGLERSSQHCSSSKDIVKKEFSSGKLPMHPHRYSGSENGSAGDNDRFRSSPSRRYSRFSNERSLSRSRSSSRSRDEEWTEKEVATRRTNNVNVSHRNVCVSQSYERSTTVYSRDRHSERNRNRLQEWDNHDRMNRDRNSMSPGTCRYLKKRDLERRSTPPSSTNRNMYRSRNQGRRNRNYSEGSDYPESCSSPLR